MVIDFHTHAGRPGQLGGEGTIEDFLRAMDEKGIDIAVVSGQGNAPEDNEFIYGLVKAHPDRLVGLARVQATLTNAPERLERYVKDFGFRGLKLSPSSEGYSPTDPLLTPLVLKCIEFDIPILFHTGAMFGRTSRTAYGDAVLFDELAIRHPEAKMVLAHGDPLGPDPYIAGKHPNVYLDTCIRFAQLARLIPGLGEELLKWMRTDEKLIYGSDAIPSREWLFEYNLDPILRMDIPEGTRNKILGGTAARLLKLSDAK